MQLKRTALSTALASAIGATSLLAATDASAITVTANWSGFFAMLGPSGLVMQNTDANTPANSTYEGYRTPVSGTLTYDTTSGAGSATMVSFSFAGGGAATFTSITLQGIGGGLVLGNMGFNWSGVLGTPVSLVLDAAGLFGCLDGAFGPTNAITGVSSTCAGVGALSATENSNLGGTASNPKLAGMGPIPLATTTWDTSGANDSPAPGVPGLGSNPSGTLPLVADTITDFGSCNLVGTSCGATRDVGIGGDPDPAGATVGWHHTFDVTSIHVTSLSGSVVPVPAAVWLFGSGLAGLVGVARRRR